jgi:hypothetical protein
MKFKLPGIRTVSFLLIIIWLFITSCASIVRASIKEDNKQIPIGFGKEDITILAVRKSNRYNKWLEERFSENYFGQYVIIDADELHHAKYQDIKKYRYIFDEAKVTRRDMSGSTGVTDTYVSFSIKDRSTGKVYKTRKIYGAPTAIMRDYLIVLEKVIRRNRENGK